VEATLYRRMGASEDLAEITAEGRDHPCDLTAANVEINDHTPTIIHPTAFTLIELLVVIAIIALLMACWCPHSPVPESRPEPWFARGI